MISEETRQKLREAGAKGGRAQVPKGFAKMPKSKSLAANRKGAGITNAKRHAKKLANDL